MLLCVCALTVGSAASAGEIEPTGRRPLRKCSLGAFYLPDAVARTALASAAFVVLARSVLLSCILALPLCASIMSSVAAARSTQDVTAKGKHEVRRCQPQQQQRQRVACSLAPLFAVCCIFFPLLDSPTACQYPGSAEPPSDPAGGPGGAEGWCVVQTGCSHSAGRRVAHHTGLCASYARACCVCRVQQRRV